MLLCTLPGQKTQAAHCSARADDGRPVRAVVDSGAVDAGAVDDAVEHGGLTPLRVGCAGRLRQAASRRVRRGSTWGRNSEPCRACRPADHGLDTVGDGIVFRCEQLFAVDPPCWCPCSAGRSLHSPQRALGRSRTAA